MILSYTELMNLGTFEDRFKYLMLSGVVGVDTFGFDRYINQNFYRSTEWRDVRHKVILRDNGCDLGIVDRPIFDKVIIHHMNPILPKDILDSTEFLLNPDYLICTTLNTHNAIHYGDISYLKKEIVPSRSLNDTCPWKI